MTTIANNISLVHKRIAESALKAGRLANDVTLVAISKTRSSREVAEAAESGLIHFGENYLQESLRKIAELRDRNLIWHFVGPIQSNKTRQIAENFDWVHSIDRLKVAQRLNEQRPENLPNLNVCVQLNFNAEDSKAGVLPDEIAALAEKMIEFERLTFRGIMAIPAPSSDPSIQLETNSAIYRIYADMQRELPDIDTLSMGMSADLEAAISAGSTMLRIGTDIFGQRARQRATATWENLNHK